MALSTSRSPVKRWKNVARLTELPWELTQATSAPSTWMTPSWTFHSRSSVNPSPPTYLVNLDEAVGVRDAAIT